jgi:crossover junction endodeoxyribonuclease RuvC
VRILGIDPGLQATGWGIVEQKGTELHCCGFGTIKTRATDSTAQRLRFLFENLFSVLEAYQPNACALETIFVNSNPQSTLKLGLARGIALAVPAFFNLFVHEYPPTTIKNSLSGYGRAEKAQIGQVVVRLLNLKEMPKKDESDALGIALTHIFRVKIF